MLTLPNCLSGLRISLVPVLLVLAWANWPQTFLAVLGLSLLTDILDGYLARKLRQTSEFGAKLDSWADLVTYPCLPLCLWWLRPDVIREEKIFLAAGICFYIAAVVFGLAKFRRLTAYHTWSGKVAVVLLGVAALIIFAGGPGWPLRIVMPIIALNCLEETAITAMLLTWRADVPTLWHAIRLREAAEEGLHSSPATENVENA